MTDKEITVTLTLPSLQAIQCKQLTEGISLCTKCGRHKYQ